MRLTGRQGPSRALLAAAVAAAVLGAGAPRASAAPFVYVTDALSAAVSQYDAGGPSLAPLVPPAVGTGVAPLGVAVSPDGTSAYVTTPEPASVRQYAIGANGGLTLASSAPVPPGAGPGQLAVSPDGRSVYVIGTGGSQGVLQYTVAASGALTPKSPLSVPTPPGPQRLAVSPDSRSVYVTTTVTGLSTVAQYTAGADGALSPKSPASLPVGGDPFAEPIGVAVSPDGRSVYVADAAGDVTRPGRILQFTAALDGALSPKSPATVAAGRSPFGVAVAADGRSVYATDAEEIGAVLQYTAAADGTLTPKSPGAVPAGSFPLGIAATADGRAVYAAGAGDDAVSQYTVGAAGTLVPRSPAAVAAGRNPVEVAVSPIAPVPTSRDQCKGDGWRRFGFRNQGQCIAFVNHAG